MKLLVTHRHAFLLGSLGLFASLFLHDWNLYPNIRPYGVPVLSVLRFLLLAMPLVLGWLLIREPKLKGVLRALIWFGWLLFLPYTIYSVSEIRHIAELCRLAQGVYTGVCVDRLWTLYPTLVYALAGVCIYVFSLSQVSARLIQSSSVKRLFILGVCLYTSAASVAGLYSRINVWDLLIRPNEAVLSLWSLASHPAFYSNIFVYFLFTTALFFVLNRVLYRAHRYIFE